MDALQAGGIQMAKESFDKEIQFLRMLSLAGEPTADNNSPTGSAFPYIPTTKRCAT